MKKNRKFVVGHCAAVALALPLTLTAIPTTGMAQRIGLNPVHARAVQITDARKINPTTVEVVYADGKQMTIDFYGENIFRLFRDDTGGIMRDPKANPPAQILTSSARRATGGVELEKKDGNIAISTPKIRIGIDRTTALMTVTNLQTGETVVKETAPAELGEKQCTLTLAAQPDEYRRQWRQQYSLRHK